MDAKNGEKDRSLIGIVNQGRFKFLADKCTEQRIDLEFLCVSMPERIAHLERHQGGRGFGSHQFWHGLRTALDLDGILYRVLPHGGPVIVPILVVGWYVGGLGLPALTLPAGLRPPLRITGGAATLLQTAEGGHIVVCTNTQVDALVFLQIKLTPAHISPSSAEELISSGGPSTEESLLSSLVLPILGAGELSCEGKVLVVPDFFKLDVGVIAEVDLVYRAIRSDE